MVRRIYRDEGPIRTTAIETKLQCVCAPAEYERQFLRIFDSLKLSAFEDTNKDTGALNAGNESNTSEDDEFYWDRVGAIKESSEFLQATNSAEMNSNLRKHAINPFERPLYFRVIHDSSSIKSESGDLLCRLSPPPLLGELEDANYIRRMIQLRTYLSSKKPTPFISVTSEFLRALNIAEYFRNYGH